MRSGDTAEREKLLHSLTLVRLKEICRASALKVSGNKGNLVQRILDHEAQQADAALHEGSQDDSRQGTPTEEFVKALERDEITEENLEEIFNVHMPQPGDIVKGMVTSLVEFGAFVELDDTGWTGLVHVSEVSDEFVDSIEDYLHPGQRVEAMVIRPPSARQDRLSLSLRRLNAPPPGDPLTHVAAEGSTERVAVLGGNLPKRMDTAEDLLTRLQWRLTAVEAVLSQLGHGPVLRAAQQEAQDATKSRSVPSMGVLLSNIPEPGEERERKRRAGQAERLALEDVLRDLGASIEGDGTEPEELEVLDALEAPGPPRQPGEKRPDALSSSRGNVLAPPESSDPTDFAQQDSLADMLNDRFIESTQLPNL